MRRSSSLVWLIVGLAVAAAGCTTSNPQFCSSESCGDGSVDAPPFACDSPGVDLDCPGDAPVCGADNVCIGCDENADCDGRPGTPVCLRSVGSCEVCNEDGVQSDNCPTAAAVCDATDHTCRACRNDDECSEGVCDNGRCAAEAEVVYMAPNGDGNLCSKTRPCKELKEALVQADATQRFISMTPGTYTNRGTDVPTAMGIRVVIAGRGSTLVREGTDNTATMFAAASNAQVEVRDLTIDGTNSDGDGVVCTGANTLVDLRRVTIQDSVGAGISSDCRLLISDSRILNSGGTGVELSNMLAVLRMQRTRILDSGGSGLLVTQGKSIIVANSIIAGSDAAQVAISQLGEVSNSYFGLNTVAAGAADGMTCTAGAQLPISDSIISGNAGVATTCTMVTYTLGVATSVPPIAGDPMLTPDFHIGSTSAARNAANPAAMLLPIDDVARDRDIDGDLRTVHRPRPRRRRDPVARRGYGATVSSSRWWTAPAWLARSRSRSRSASGGGIGRSDSSHTTL
jgi:hypothetical protein